MNQQLLDAALEVIGGGIPTFPCRPDKRPWTAHGFHDATLDPERVRYWWTNWVPGANVAIPTGAVSGTVVVDIDVKHVDGFTSWTTLMTTLSVDYHVTFSVTTPSGGIHYHYIHPGVPIACTVGLVDGVDVRGDGGYVLIPPSRDETGAAYEVEHDVARAPLPAPLLDLLTRPAGHKPPTDPFAELAIQLDRAPVGGDYVQAAFAGEVQRVMDAAAGSRNHALNKAAYKLGRIPDTNDEEIEGALMAAASAVGLVTEDGEARCAATIRSGLQAGRANPRHR